MRHINYLLLSFLIIVLAIPNYCTAQMQYVIATSTKRIIPIQNVKPIKSLPLDNQTQILTLSRYESGNTTASVFSLMTNGNVNLSYSYFTNLIVEDFVLCHNLVYFCGQDLTANCGFFCVVKVNDLINGNVLFYKYVLPSFTSFSKIDYYMDHNRKEKVSLISNTYTFVDVDLMTITATKYERNQTSLVDVKHTKDFVVVLAQINNGLFGLYAFNKNNINTFLGCTFSTPTLYTYNDNTFINTPDYHYLLEVLDAESTNNVAVGFSANDIYSGTEVCNIDLSNNMNIVNTQAVISSNEGRSFLYDMKYSTTYKGLICLIWNSAKNLTDNIFMMYPSKTQSYTIPITIPELNIRRHLLYYLTPYDDRYYLTGGNINNSVYLFDKRILDYSNLNCLDKDTFEVESIDRVVNKRDTICLNSDVIPITPSTIMSNGPISNGYNIICQ